MPYEYYATVHRVLDGDTTEVTLLLGFDIQLGPKTLRFYGLNAAEIHDPDPVIHAKAQAALDFVTSKLLPADPALTPKVMVRTQKPDSSDKYGRILGTVLYQPPVPKVKPKKGVKPAPVWINLNQEMLDAGLVKPYFGEGEKPF